MNEADKKRLLYLCSICGKDSVVIFEDKIAYTINNSHSFEVTLSKPISPAKVGIQPVTLQSIINTLPEKDITVEHSGDFKYKFKSGNLQRIITAMDAEYAPRPNIEDPDDEFQILKPEQFANAISFAASFADKDIFSITSNVFLKFTGNSTDIYATNRTTMAYSKYEQKLPFESDKNIVLCKDHIPAVVKVLTDDDTKIAQMKIDKSGRILISTEFSSAVLFKFSGEFRDFVKIMDEAAAINSNREKKPDAQWIDADNTELRQSLNNISSMFVKNEYPYVDIHIYKEKINLESEVLSRGYDCFRASIPAKSTGEFSSRVSPILFLKALSKVKGARIYWRSNSPAQVNPFVLDNGKEMVFFAPMKIEPKGDEDE